MQHLAIALERPSDPTLAPVLGDLRFRALMSEADWAALPVPIRRRFSKRLSGGNTAIYVGEVLETWMSLPGWCLVQLARLIGAPLPTDRRKHSPSVVTVTEDIASGGQVWTRLYVRNGFPQVIHSAKRFAGVTGLEEYVGYGISMALTVHVKDEALIFRSAGYFLNVLGRRIPLPRGSRRVRSRLFTRSLATADSASRCRSSIRGSACCFARWPFFMRSKDDVDCVVDPDRDPDRHGCVRYSLSP